FPSGALDFLAVAMQYKENGKPGGSESKSRRVGFVGNASYSFEDRYFVDASFRTDGSSLYGADKRFAPFWSAGIGWNIHRENFMSNVDWINRLKIRASVGETGSNNFSAYEAMVTYTYSLSDRYYNWMGANLKALANPDLEWQKTMKYNTGVEVNLLNNRLNMICDLYLERTNGLMSSLELPPSNGFTSYKANIGKLENKGFELKVTGYLLRDTERELIWSVTGSLVRNKDKIIKLSEAMKEANATLLATGGATPNKVWQEGDSQNAIYAVPSLGIDPINGRELFLKKSGEVTYTWDARDRVFCGVDQPDYRGNINTMFMWRDLSVNLSFGYEWGGQQYNSTLINRVENADKKYNVDRRVYEDRWKEPGDRTFFKGIKETTATQATSRFVQDEATFTCQNLNITYDLKGNKWLRHNLGIQTLTLKGDIADLFRISTIKQERGTSYPFSRQFSFTLSVMF
ncbi:TonB-dependent receptor domain-containing protein, partial [Odoribacter splanchnicus]